MLETYSKVQDILNGHNDITNHVKKIFDGEIYNNDEITAFIGSMYDILSDTVRLKKYIFFDFLEKDQKFTFASEQLKLLNMHHVKLDAKTRLATSPKSADLIEFVKRDFYCEGLSDLYQYMHCMYKLSPESFIAIWSIAITNGTFSDLLQQYKKEEPVPIRKKRKRR